jgi:DNA-binding Xre family transcriptional regulator
MSLKWNSCGKHICERHDLEENVSTLARRQMKTLTPQQLEALEGEVEEDLLALDLQAIRELLGKMQTEVAHVIDMTQSEVSRLERRPDVRLSTLKRYVEALRGGVEIFTTFGDKRVRLRGAGKGSMITRGTNMFSLSG